MINIAVVGATGLVGNTVIELLAERRFPINTLYPLASERSVGKYITFHQKSIAVQDIKTFDFSKVHLAFFAAGSKVSATYVKKIGCTVIDKASLFRMEPNVPLIVPEVNGSLVHRQKIIASPNCVAIPMAIALKPLYDAVGIARINAATYQSVSGAGQKGLRELGQQTRDILDCQAVEAKVFAEQIAFNVIPYIEEEEPKIVQEMQKIFHDPHLNINVTAVRVPVCYGHAMALHIETDEKITPAQAQEILAQSPGIVLTDMPTPIGTVNKPDGVYVGRVREDTTHPRGLNLWVVADNIRKGAALNAVQIAELIYAGGD